MTSDDADDNSNAPATNQSTPIADDVSDWVESELARIERQAAADDIDFRLTGEGAEIVLSYEFADGYDLKEDPKGLTEPEVVTDGGVVTEATFDEPTAPDDGTHTRFQLEILYTLADEGALYGLAIKRSLEDYYGEEVNRGRLYPNLDDLVDAGLVEKSERDKRTNEYGLTAKGKELVRRDAQRRHHIADELGGGD